MVGRSTVPKPVSVVGTQITSRKRDTTLSAVVIAFPYLALNGSNTVIHFLSLIGSTKNKPPTLVKSRHGHESCFIIMFQLSFTVVTESKVQSYPQ